MGCHMKLLRIKGYQKTACYKKPFAFKVGETFPLPPFSTVKGMLHAALEAKSYIPMKLSIQGDYETMLIDYQKKFMYKELGKTAALDYPLTLNVAGLGKGEVDYGKNISTMPMYEHMLFGVSLVIHISAEPHVLQEIYDRILSSSTPISIGRSEDLLRLDSIEFVDVQEGKTTSKFSQYIPIDDDALLDLEDYPTYQLPTVYNLAHGRRQWEYAIVKLVAPNEYHMSVPIDNEGYSVFLIS